MAIKQVSHNNLDRENSKSIENIEFPILSDMDSIEKIFDSIYRYLSQLWNIIELDLFIIEGKSGDIAEEPENSIIVKLPNITPSVSLENIYSDLEERGLLEWAANSNEIKIIPNFDASLEQIKSIIIIPIKILNKTAAFFLANSPLTLEEINSKVSTQFNLSQQINNAKMVAQYSFLLFSILKSTQDKTNSYIEYNLLKSQTLLASNQIAMSEIILFLQESFELPLKVIKTNIELIQKEVGDSKRRIDILFEQFKHLQSAYNISKNLSNHTEYVPANHSIIDIIESAMEIAGSHLSKNGISMTTNISAGSNEFNDDTVFGYRVQLVFAFLNIMLNSTSTMPDGGNINIGIYKFDNHSKGNIEKMSIIISDNGTGVGIPEINGDIINLMDISDKKMKMRFLFLISQQIISNHNGKFSVFTESGKGTTYKVILPLV